MCRGAIPNGAVTDSTEENAWSGWWNFEHGASAEREWEEAKKPRLLVSRAIGIKGSAIGFW
jgi:hypothetical protein